MTSAPFPKHVLFVTGMSGAGKSTALKTFEDMGWEVVDNLPLRLLERLIATPLGESNVGERPLAFGIDGRTRDFDAQRIVDRITQLREEHGSDIGILFLDCSGPELARRYSETRRRHPLGQDRPAADGIDRERELLEPLRHAADHLIDTTDTSTNGLQQELRSRFVIETQAPVLSVMSFGFARGLPRNADLVFDMRFLRNPHWDPVLRPLSGLDASVADHIAADPRYEPAIARIEDLLLLLLPSYAEEGKSYITVAFGCTGGRHRSVHVADRVARRLQDAGFSPTIAHRDLGQKPNDALERKPGRKGSSGSSVSK
jgi:UPF0042 nucleotide-binding protein